MKERIINLLLTGYILCGVVTFGHAYKYYTENGDAAYTANTIISTMLWPFYISRILWE